MLRMIIADDERAIREAIGKSIDWQAIGISVVGLAKNGSEAYELILDESPDIVLTDICMPGFSGLELIARISQTMPQTVFIILSGYGEFEYAQEAMRWGIKHYLLKPCTSEQLIEAVKKAISECYHRRMLRDMQNEHHQLLYALKQSVICNTLTELFARHQPLSDIIETHTPYLDFDGVSYDLYWIDCEEGHTMVQAIKHYLNTNEPGVVLHALYTQRLVCIFFETYDTIYTGIENVLRQWHSIKKTDSLTWRHQVFPSLRKLLEALMAKLLPFDFVCITDAVHEIILNNHEAFLSKAQSLMEVLNSAIAKQEQRVRIEAMLDALQDEGFRNFVLSVAANYGIYFSEKRYVSPAPSFLSDRHARKTAIDDIVIYVQSHISDPNLSLKWLAENQFYMNADYLSKQFTKQTGEKFSAFLNRTRIECAREILRSDPCLPIYSVAENVGLGNSPQYFSHLFKRATGMTPSEYVEYCKQDDSTSTSSPSPSGA